MAFPGDAPDVARGDRAGTRGLLDLRGWRQRAHGLPDGIPVPADAAVVVGPGGGYDAGATLYAFSSDLGPAAALGGYEAQLTAAGYARVGSNGPWQLYRYGATLVAVRAGQSGPPTDLLVRVTTTRATAMPAGGSAQAGGGGGVGGTGGASGAASGGPATGSSAAAGTSSANGNPNPGGQSGAKSNPNGNGKANGHPVAPTPAGVAAPTAAPNGNALGTANGNPDPGSNVGGNGNPATPVPQPPPPNGQPTAPPGQVGRTPPPGAAKTPKP